MYCTRFWKDAMMKKAPSAYTVLVLYKMMNIDSKRIFINFTVQRAYRSVQIKLKNENLCD